ncbi:hypothetical protein DFH06DRAFT_1472617 [Mycena polygramma]|nr:hypothetical protein DFH06DRAFT_1472617 [Mycena polygramma]
MENNEEPTGFRSLSDNERLIDTLKSGFSDLIKKQGELQKTVESLKPQIPTDKKTTFWTAYMKVADEHDKEFQQRYSTDLDAALIFAGLFSAVSAAFIIQLEQSNPLEPKAPITIVAVQGLLFTSLFTALLAALLAVLGKQWVMHYQAAGSRGTVEERGLERQRKLDGLRKWKLDMVLQMFPLLLQLALLLFSIGLSLYLWPVNRSVAGLVVGSTVFGFGTYMLLLASAIVFPDSPFQTPLASFLKHVFSPTFRILRTVISRVRNLALYLRASLARFVNSKTAILPSFMHRVPRHSEPLALKLRRHTDPALRFSDTSVEAPAVLWLLEVSTDPIMVTAAAGMAADLQWPLDWNYTPAMARLTEIFDSCFDVITSPRYIHKLRGGMAHCAIHCGMGLGSLRHVAQASGRKRITKRSDFAAELQHQDTLTPALTKQLSGVFWTLKHTPRAIDWFNATSPTKWELHVFASLDSTLPIGNIGRFLDQFEAEKTRSLDDVTFGNYLCCVNAFFGTVDPRILVEVDKSRLKLPLMTQLFKGLQRRTVDTALSGRLVRTTARLATTSEDIWYPDMLGLMTEICQFCTTFPAEDEPLRNRIFVSASTLTTVDNLGHFQGRTRKQLQRTEWIFPALKFVQRQWEDVNGGNAMEWDSATTLAIQSLLQFLAYTESGYLPREPPSSAVQIIVRALSQPGDVSLLAFLILCHAPQWFLNPIIEPILQDSSVWRQLGRVAVKYPALAIDYIGLGKKIAHASEWKLAIHADLPAWLNAYIGIPYLWDSSDWEAQFIAVIYAIWVRPEHGRLLDRNNESWILAITALTNVWDTLELLPSLRECLRLARCTAATSLRANYLYLDKYTPISHNIRAIFSVKLGKSLVQSAIEARSAISLAQSEELPMVVVDRVAELLTRLGEKIGTEFGPASGEVALGGAMKSYANWEELQRHFDAEIDALEELLGVEHVR